MPTPYRFRFIHNDPQNPNPTSPLYPTRFGTVCEIIDSSGGILSVGISTLAPSDKYSKPLGRKLSAARAIRGFLPRRALYHVAAYKDYPIALKNVYMENFLIRKALWEQLFAESPSTRAAKRGA